MPPGELPASQALVCSPGSVLDCGALPSGLAGSSPGAPLHARRGSCRVGLRVRGTMQAFFAEGLCLQIVALLACEHTGSDKRLGPQRCCSTCPTSSEQALQGAAPL